MNARGRSLPAWFALAVVAACDGSSSGSDAGPDADVDVEVDADVDSDRDAGPTDADDESSDAGELEADTADADDDSDDTSDADGDDGLVDLDDDGISDEREAEVARRYLPFLSVDPGDDCPLSVIVYRLGPHPDEPSLLHMVVVRLFERDCGAGGHVGDNEVFGMTIDDSMPAPAGILAIRAVSHQGTLCEHLSECGSCDGLPACATAPRGGVGYPVVFYSDGKHGAYMSEEACDFACFFTNYCSLAPESSDPPMVNAGEPSAPLVRDLTEEGLITAAAGWSETSLFDYDPWGGEDFGTAGSVADDLTDDVFVTPVCRP
jgi:hypothetical protein